MSRPLNAHRESGAALIVALIFLIVLTFLGLAAMSSNRVQLREAYGITEHTLAFQAAESGVAEGERWLELRSTRPLPECVEQCSDNSAVWNAESAALELNFANFAKASWWDAHGRIYGHRYEAEQPVAQIPGQVIPGLAEHPRYVIEELGRDPTASLVTGDEGPTLWYYRITARGTGVQTDPAAIVQTIYAKAY